MSYQRIWQLSKHQQVRELAVQGSSVAAIARQLKITKVTVRKYRDVEQFRDQCLGEDVADPEMQVGTGSPTGSGCIAHWWKLEGLHRICCGRVGTERRAQSCRPPGRPIRARGRRFASI
jgi:hypothetical protein